MNPPTIASALPPNHLLTTFSSLPTISTQAQAIFDNLTENNNTGNQYILVQNIPEAIQTHLDDDKNALEVAFRLSFEGSTVLLKIIPNHHGLTTSSLITLIDEVSSTMGLPVRERGWSGNTTYKISNAVVKGKQPDECFIPISRKSIQGRPLGWPTLVIENGVSESHSKLHEDAKWWFRCSEGDVRFVIVLSIKQVTKEICLEKWMLKPEPASHPYIDQRIVITPSMVTGDPLVLDFRALFDRAPGESERDIVVDTEDLLDMARWF